VAERPALEQLSTELARVSSQRIINRGRSAGIRSRIVSRATRTAADRVALRPPGPGALPAPSFGPTPTAVPKIPVGESPIATAAYGLALLAIVALVAVFLQLVRTTQERDTLRGNLAALTEVRQATHDSLRRVTTERDTLVASFARRKRAITGSNKQMDSVYRRDSVSR